MKTSKKTSARRDQTWNRLIRAVYPHVATNEERSEVVLMLVQLAVKITQRESTSPATARDLICEAVNICLKDKRR